MIRHLFFLFIGVVSCSLLFGQKLLTGVVASKLLADSSWQPTPGVQARKLTYLDHLGKRVEVRVIKATLHRHRLVMEAATPDNKDAFGRQSVPEEMSMEQGKGREVLIGINADFFNMANGTPLGPVVKEGRIIKGVTGKMSAFVGVNRSGRIIMGDSLDFRKHKKRLVEALGARPLLIANGKLLAQDSSSLSTVHHPRSALGVIGKKTVLLVTVDGRQPAVSNGISLTDLAKLMRYLGAGTAVNLDGGGSTTLVVKNGNTGDYMVQNSPSGKTLRPVANSWILVKIN